MKKIIRNIFIIALLSTLYFSCSCPKQLTEIKPVVVHPEIIEDTVRVTSRTDSVIIGIETIRNDTVMIVKYFPEYQKFYVKAKPDSIIFYDTTRIIQYIEKEDSFWNAQTYIVAGLIIVILIVLITRK